MERPYGEGKNTGLFPSHWHFSVYWFMTACLVSDVEPLDCIVVVIAIHQISHVVADLSDVGFCRSLKLLL